MQRPQTSKYEQMEIEKISKKIDTDKKVVKNKQVDDGTHDDGDDEDEESEWDWYIFYSSIICNQDY